MSIVKKNFFIICSIISTVLLLILITTYIFFNHFITNQFLTTQKLIVESNNIISQNFTNSINELIYQYGSDQELGELLSRTTNQNTLHDVNTKINMNDIISHHLASQNTLLHNNFSATFYVNPSIPVSELFNSKNTVINVSKVFSANMVINESWYEAVLKSLQGKYIFINKENNELCFAFRLQNSFYAGPYDKNGVGVILCSLPIEELPNLFNVTPITPNSRFVILDQNGNSIYQSKKLSTDNLPQLNSAISGKFTILDNEQYLASSKSLDWGIRLAFLTPYSDIIQEVNRIMIPYIYYSLLFLIIGCLSSFFISKNISKPLVSFVNKIESIDDIRNVKPDYFEIKGPKEIIKLKDSFINLTQNVQKLINQIREYEIIQKETELKGLQAQINPHFILNAMNAVNAMALMKEQDDIAETVDSIANLMRYSITEPNQMVSVTTEVNNIREYISIYTLRFRQKIDLQLNIDCADSQAIIPKFTLQPLVENSIRHGISREDEGIKINIHAYTDEENLYVEVIDTGAGADADKLNKYLNYEDVHLKVTHGFGIRNVNERLKLHFGNKGHLKYFYNNQHLLVACITIPLNEKNTL